MNTTILQLVAIYNIQQHVFGPVCRPSSSCPKKLLSDYTVRVVILDGGRDLVLHHKSWD